MIIRLEVMVLWGFALVSKVFFVFDRMSLKGELYKIEIE